MNSSFILGLITHEKRERFWDSVQAGFFFSYLFFFRAMETNEWVQYATAMMLGVNLCSLFFRGRVIQLLEAELILHRIMERTSECQED